jgi:tripartite-type tricarboxylate transporter receptor subunit TctC
MPDMISGRISLFFDNMASGLPFVQSQKLRGLAVTSRARSKLAPNLPTMIEAGVPGYEVASWSALVVPAGTPKPIVSRLNTEIVKILKDPQVRVQLEGLGVESVGSSADELGALLQREREKWAKVVKDAKITVE